MIQNDKPRVIVKNKNLQFVFDYCIESKTPFSVNPRLSGDEWEVEFKISDIMGAVALGMFLRENRMEPVGVQIVKPQAAVAQSVKAKPAKAKKTDNAEISEPVFATTAAANQNPAPVFEQNQVEPVAEIVKEEEEMEEAAATEAGGFSPEMLFDEN